jgi:hypothetical protein
MRGAKSNGLFLKRVNPNPAPLCCPDDGPRLRSVKGVHKDESACTILAIRGEPKRLVFTLFMLDLLPQQRSLMSVLGKICCQQYLV